MLPSRVFRLLTIVFASFAALATAQQKDSDEVTRSGLGAKEVSEANVVFKASFDWKLNTHEEHQFLLKDGALHVTRNKDAKHSANLLHKAEFQNGTMAMRFKLVNKDDSFQVQFRDAAFTQVKQGMLFNVRLGEGKLELQDAVVAYGVKQEMKSAKSAEPTVDQQAELDKATVSAPLELLSTNGTPC